MNKFEEFLQRVCRRVSPPAAFDLGRDAQTDAIKKMLFEKGICTKEELDKMIDEELEKSAERIEKLPPLPK